MSAEQLLAAHAFARHKPPTQRSMISPTRQAMVRRSHQRVPSRNGAELFPENLAATVSLRKNRGHSARSDA